MSTDPAPWRRQSSQISGNGASSPSPGPPPGAPPPPPPYVAGAIPSLRMPTEMRKEPPAAIQNAMMTKDKKPFTYTPGGLDLNEIRSPRMAKRLSRNAHLEDSCTPAVTAAPPPPPIHPQQLPPLTVAAMQPQIAVAVLPQGVKLPKSQSSPPVNQMVPTGPAPPPPPMPVNASLSSPLANNEGSTIESVANNTVPVAPPLPSNVPPLPNNAPPMPSNAPPMPSNAPPPPPPPMPSNGGPPPPPPLPGNGTVLPKPIPSEIVPPASGYISPSDTLRRNQPRPDYIADIANHAHTLKRVNQAPRSHAEPQTQNFPPIQLRQTGFHHTRTKSNDETPPENDVTDKVEPRRIKTPSPPKTVSNGSSPIPVEQQVAPVKSPVPQNQPAPRPNFQQPLQQAPRPSFPTSSPSPTVANQPRPFRPQMSSVTPTTPEIQRQRYSPPRTSPPREVFTKSQPPAQPAPSPQPMTSPIPSMNNQQRGFPPQSSPAPPDVIGPIYNQTRISPPREVVTVFQPQVFQDTGSARQTERFQGKSRPPGLKMPDEKEQGPRPTPPSSAGLRQAPAPWMSTPRSMSKEVPPWASREDSTPTFRSPPPSTIQITTRIVPMHMESRQPEQQKAAPSPPQGKVHIIPIRIEGSDDVIKPQPSQQNKYDHPDSAQMYQQQVPMMQQQQVPMAPNQHMPQMPMSPNPHMPHMPMSPNHHMPQMPMSPNHHMPQMPMTQNQHMPQMPPMGQHQMAVAPQPPRGWSPVSSPPVQSRSFRVLQKITGSDQEEAPVYSEMMSPPVYTMPPSYPPNFYNMRSPTYDSNAGQQDSGSGNYWVWDANSQNYVPSGNPSNGHCNPSTPTPGSDPGWHWEGDPSQAQSPQDGAYPSNYDYWNYPPQNEEEQRQFWEHYGQMCAYLAQLNAAACRYSPYPCPPLPYQSDSEECGYSSNDEMTYYGQMFKQKAQQAQQYWQNSKPQSTPGSSDSTPKVPDDTADEKEEDSDSSDTETENLEKMNDNKNTSDGSEGSDDESSHSCTEIPHQLSVIYEESEPQSEADSRISIQPSDDEDSSATLENDSRKTSADNTSSDTESSIVRVRLPLKLKFSQSTDDCQVATVIVGDSEMESSPDVRSEDVWSPTPERNLVSPPPEQHRTTGWSVCNSEDTNSPLADVCVTISLNKKKRASPAVEEDTEALISNSITTDESFENDTTVDFWKEIKGSSDDETSSRQSNTESRVSPLNWDLSSSQTSIQTVKRESSESENSEDESGSESSEEEEEEEAVQKVDEAPAAATFKYSSANNIQDNSHSSDDESESDSESSDENQESRDSESSASPMKCGSVRRNIDLIMFKNSIDNDKSREGDESDNDDSSDSDSSCANLSLALDGQNDERTEERLNERSVEESEEDDSGVTSDLSRHISETDTDAECGSELSKMTRYQRAATHSRLFKLLQDECGDDESDDNSAAVPKRERLTLPLVGNSSKSNISSDQESSSSGINSPMSPAVNERLIKELVQSLLSRRKGRHFRKLPLEKLYTAAARILQEDMDYDTGSTSDDSNMFLSPCDNSRLEHPPGVQLPNPENYGENYYDYCDYYSSWADAAYYSNQPNYDIVPSKAFKTLQDTTERDRNKRDFSVPVRCPKLSLPKCISKETKTDTAPPET